MTSWNQDNCQIAWNFAALVHNGQLVPGSSLPYINHIGNVAMEVMNALSRRDDIEKPDIAVQCALLHDVIEDTKVTYEEVVALFGKDVADGVLALTKNKALSSKEQQMKDSLERIKACPGEVWMVKLADRITNLQPPPEHWTVEKAEAYREEARLILDELGDADSYLATRLKNKIENYRRQCRRTLAGLSAPG